MGIRVRGRGEIVRRAIGKRKIGRVGENREGEIETRVN